MIDSLIQMTEISIKKTSHPFECGDCERKFMTKEKRDDHQESHTK